MSNLTRTKPVAALRAELAKAIKENDLNRVYAISKLLNNK